MAQQDMHSSGKIYRGTLEEVFSHRGEIPPGAIVELTIVEPEAQDDFGGRTLADVLRDIGAVEGLPADLSTNPDYMRGFGESKSHGKP